MEFQSIGHGRPPIGVTDNQGEFILQYTKNGGVRCPANISFVLTSIWA